MGASRSRWLPAWTVLGAFVLIGAPAAHAQAAGSGTRTDDGDDGPRVVLTGGIDLAEGEGSEDVVVFDGDAIVDGVVSVLLLLTLVALPLGLIGLLSLALLYALGLVVASLVLGRRLVREPRGAVLAFTAGRAILRLVDLIPVLGDLITAAATVFGVGALAVAGWRAARGPASTPAPGPAPATTAASP